MTRSAAAELSSWGIRVNAVCPGTTKTPIRHFPRRRPLRQNSRTPQRARCSIAEPAEIAEAVVFCRRTAPVTSRHTVDRRRWAHWCARWSIGVASQKPS
jgi:3-oxoacyl-[acyl-carrier protein] reductase